MRETPPGPYLFLLLCAKGAAPAMLHDERLLFGESWLGT